MMDTMKNGVRIVPLPLGFDGYVGLTNQFYVSAGVLNGPHYKNGKPSYLQSWEHSRKLHIRGDRVGLIVNFALGVSGGLYLNRSVAHYGTYVLELPQEAEEAYYIWAELNEDGATMSFGYSSKKELTYTRWEPEEPDTGDYWFDVTANMMKLRKSKEVELPGGQIELEHYWEEVKRVILGWVAQGTDDYIYSMTSYPLHYWFAQQYAEFVKYDGVSFKTNGLYIADNYDSWKDNIEICTNIANSSVTRDAVYYGAGLWADPIGTENEMLTGKMLVGWTEQDVDVGLDAINFAGMEALAFSPGGMEKTAASVTAMEKAGENELAVETITDQPVAMDKITNSESAMDEVVSVDRFMDRITEKTMAMETVTDKEMPVDKMVGSVLAMSYITDKEMPMQKITDKEMPTDKVVESSNAMDHIMVKEPAMEIMASKPMPMEKVAASNNALTKILGHSSALRIISESEVAAGKILDSSYALSRFNSNVQGRTRLFTNQFSLLIFSNYKEVRDDLFNDITTVSSGGTPSFTYHDDYLRVRSYAGTNSSNEVEGHYVTDVKVDLTHYSKLKIEWRNAGADHPYNYSYIGLISSKTERIRLQSYYLEITRNFNQKTDELDISSVNGQYYIGAAARSRGGTSGYASDLYVYKIWLEE